MKPTIAAMMSILLIMKLMAYLLFKIDKLKECLESMNERKLVREKIGINNKFAQETKVRWMKEEIHKMLEMKQQGYGNPAIGQILNRSTHSIAQKLTKLNVENSSCKL